MTAGGTAFRVVVTGADGFVGRHLTAALAGSGYEVVPCGRPKVGAPEAGADIADRAAVLEWFARHPAPDVVVHLAAIAHNKAGKGDPGVYERVNHRGAAHVLEAARRSGARRFVFLSTASVYGEVGRRGPVAEAAGLAPVGPYAESKVAAERECGAALEAGFDCVILRPPAIYSTEWLLNVRTRAYLPLSGARLFLSIPGPQPRFSLCAIGTVTAALELAVAGRVPPGTYNVADEAPYTQTTIREVIAALDGPRPRVPLPRAAVGAPLTALAACSPPRVRRALLNNYWKLFHGLVLDTGKLAATGFRPHARLQDLPGIVSAPAELVGARAAKFTLVV